jgi:hypothetical protein
MTELLFSSSVILFKYMQAVTKQAYSRRSDKNENFAD